MEKSDLDKKFRKIIYSDDSIFNKILKIIEFREFIPNSSQKEILRTFIIQELEESDYFGDEYGWNFQKTIKFIKKFLENKDLVVFLNHFKRMDSILYPDAKEEYYPLDNFIEAVVEGLISNDKEFCDATISVIKKISNLLLELLYRLISYSTNDWLIESIVYFLNEIYNQGGKEYIIQIFIKLTKEEKNNFIIGMKEFVKSLSYHSVYEYSIADIKRFGKFLIDIVSGVYKEDFKDLNCPQCEINVLKEIERMLNRRFRQINKEEWKTQDESYLVENNNVIKISLYNSGLLKLPESIGELKELKELNVEGCKLKELPESIGNLDMLIFLNIRNNYSLVSLPESLGNLKSLEKLDLSNNMIDSLPNSMGNLKNLRKLKLSHNYLKAIPDSIGNLEFLQVLDLRRNELKNISEDIGNLKELRYLDISSNEINRLPKTIGNLTLLEEIYMDNNKIAELPESIGNLISLKKLRIGSNQLKNLPNSIGNLFALQELWLSNNQLEKISESIGNLTSLTTLNISGNKLKNLPLKMANLKALKRFWLDGNDFYRDLRDYMYKLNIQLYMENNARNIQKIIDFFR